VCHVPHGYLRKATKYLVEETDGQDRRRMSDWWRKFHVMAGCYVEEDCDVAFKVCTNSEALR
jgi:hypothetical protein